MAHDTMQAWLVRVRGRVQGVGYRFACLQHARALGITGWIRNRSDGSVEALLQGAHAPLQAMCSWMRNDVPGALVESMDVADAPPPDATADGFQQRPTE